jgi:hypothetical protein
MPPQSQTAVNTIRERVVPEVSQAPDLAPTISTVLIATIPRQVKNTQ